MSIIKHPTNCECEYEFPHSLIVNERFAKVDGEWSRIITTYVVCRECNHWIGGKPDRCRCPFECHSESGGMTVDIRSASAVDCH